MSSTGVPRERPPAPKPAGGRLLLVFAHPDDEAFFTAGTVSKHVACGGEAWLVAATCGEHGSQPVPPICDPRDLGRVRAGELVEACLAMGITRLVLLGYEDRRLSEADQDEAADRVARVMDECRPAAVVTFGPDGIYGHPDHIAAGKLTEKAFERSFARGGAGEASDVAGGAGMGARLWHVSLASAFWRYREKAWTAAAEDAGVAAGPSPGRQGGRRPIVPGQPEAGIDVAGFLEVKAAALLAHRTQRHNLERAFGSLYDFDARAPRNAESLVALSREWFTLARGPKPDHVLEDSLIEA